MTNQNIFSIILKVVAIFLLLKVLELTSFAVSGIAGYSRDMLVYLYINIGFIVLYLIAAILLFILSEPIAGILAGKRKDDELNISVSASDLGAIVLFAIGVYLVITGFSALAGSIGQVIANKIMFARFGKLGGTNSLDPRYWSELIASAFKLLLGLYLTFGFRGLSNAIKKLREA